MAQGERHLPVMLPSGPATTTVAFVSGNLFQTLGTPATLGRLLTTHDGAEAVAMSETLWRRHYNADPNVIGRTIVIAGHPYTIVGVSPSGFTGLRLIDEGTDETSQPRRAHLLTS